jgi:NADH-quinone oxidoreductase subunit C
LLKEQLADAVQEQIEAVPGQMDAVFIDKGSLLEACRFLRDAKGLKFEFLTSITGTDMQAAGEIHLAYVLTSMELKQRFTLKVKQGRDSPSVPSVMAVWPAADWLEREMYDLLGVEFTGHKDLRRLLLPDDWKGHPLRKDFKEQPDYHGIPTTRKSWLEE